MRLPLSDLVINETTQFKYNGFSNDGRETKTIACEQILLAGFLGSQLGGARVALRLEWWLCRQKVN